MRIWKKPRNHIHHPWKYTELQSHIHTIYIYIIWRQKNLHHKGRWTLKFFHWTCEGLSKNMQIASYSSSSKKLRTSSKNKKQEVKNNHKQRLKLFVIAIIWCQNDSLMFSNHYLFTKSSLFNNEFFQPLHMAVKVSMSLNLLN